MNKHSPVKPLKKGSWKLAHDIAFVNGFTLDELRSRDRSKAISAVRATIIRALNVHGTHPNGIARILNKNHASILYYINPCPSKLKRRIK